MKPILRARLASSDDRGFMLDCGDGAAMRIVALRRRPRPASRCCAGARSRQKRTWAVPAYGEADTDWAGRARLDDSSWPAVATEIAASPTQVTLTTQALRLAVTLDRFRMDWALPDGTIFARDRETQPYFLGQKNHAFKHAMARAPGDRHYGARRQDRPARPDRAAAQVRDARFARLRSRARRSALQELAVPDRARRGRAASRTGSSTTTAPRAAFDLGCEHDNYFGRYRDLRGRGRRPRSLSDPRARGFGTSPRNSSR